MDANGDRGRENHGAVTIVRLGPDDWQLWRQVRRAALTEAPGAFGSTLEEWSGAGDTPLRWRDRLASVPLNLVLTMRGEPVGMVSATAPGDRGAVKLISLWVAPKGRGHGIGDAAIEQVVKWASSEHPGSSVVLSVRDDNDHARRLYDRHGFRDAGPSPDDPDERLMRRAVPGPS